MSAVAVYRFKIIYFSVRSDTSILNQNDRICKDKSPNPAEPEMNIDYWILNI
jgi:hypothetical protein